MLLVSTSEYNIQRLPRSQLTISGAKRKVEFLERCGGWILKYDHIGSLRKKVLPKVFPKGKGPGRCSAVEVSGEATDCVRHIVGVCYVTVVR